MGRVSGWSLVILLLIAGALVPATAGVATASSAAAGEPAPVRILITGDSVTHGSSGDWTWRYRLWEGLRSAGVAINFVGPRDDLWTLGADVGGDHSYADPDFDSEHAARWGLSSGLAEQSMTALVETYAPDVVIEMLGVIDLIFLGRAPADVAVDVGQRIAAARALDPDIAYVVAEGTQTWFPRVPELNEALAGAVAAAGGAVSLADTDAGYDAAADTHDNSHANARGEVKIAAAVADALAELGIGVPAPRPLVMPEVGPRTPAALAGELRDGVVHLGWDPAPGATSQMLWWRDGTASGSWNRSTEPLYGTEATLPGFTASRRYEFRLQPRKGDDVPQGAVFSNVVALGTAPLRPPSSTPPSTAAPGRPAGLRARTGRRCVVLRWARVPGATGYVVERRRGGAWRQPVTTSRRTVRLGALPARRAWRFRVRATAAGVTGEPATILVRRAARGKCR